jgi:hypothetical protein
MMKSIAGVQMVISIIAISITAQPQMKPVRVWYMPSSGNNHGKLRAGKLSKFFKPFNEDMDPEIWNRLKGMIVFNAVDNQQNCMFYDDIYIEIHERNLRYYIDFKGNGITSEFVPFRVELSKFESLLREHGEFEELKLIPHK